MITQQQRKELTLAAVDCEHQINADCIRLWRDPTKEGTALAQLMDRIEAKVRQYIEQGAQPGADGRALLAEQARPTQVMQEARETLLIAAANFGGVAPSARDRCIRAANALHEVYTAQPLKAEQAKDAAEDAELLDRYGKIRGDLKASAYCVGNEYKPFHPGASHVRPEWRDGWNACYVAAIRAARAAERKA